WPGRDREPEASKSQRLGRASGGGLPDPADLTPARPSAPAARSALRASRAAGAAPRSPPAPPTRSQASISVSWLPAQLAYVAWQAWIFVASVPAGLEPLVGCIHARLNRGEVDHGEDRQGRRHSGQPDPPVAGN